MNINNSFLKWLGSSSSLPAKNTFDYFVAASVKLFWASVILSVLFLMIRWWMSVLIDDFIILEGHGFVAFSTVMVGILGSMITVMAIIGGTIEVTSNWNKYSRILKARFPSLVKEIEYDKPKEPKRPKDMKKFCSEGPKKKTFKRMSKEFLEKY